MPNLTADQIDGFMKTFSFYVKFPKSDWNEIDTIRMAKNGEHWNLFEKRTKMYYNTYLNPVVKKTADGLTLVVNSVEMED